MTTGTCCEPPRPVRNEKGRPRPPTCLMAERNKRLSETPARKSGQCTVHVRRLPVHSAMQSSQKLVETYTYSLNASTKTKTGVEAQKFSLDNACNESILVMQCYANITTVKGLKGP